MSSVLANNRFLRTLARQPVDRTPVWLMRQAGRYLPEYRSTRARAGDFLTLCKTPELACEVTIQPVERYELDAAILFSDILTIPDAMGLGLHFVSGEGPAFERPVRTADAVARLGVPDPEVELRYVIDAVRDVKRSLAGRIPLIGFAGSPWTLASYMIEGKSSRDFQAAKAIRYGCPELLDALLAKLSEAVALHLSAQVRAGVDALMIFDTWGGILDPAGYHRYSLGSIRRVVGRLAQLAPDVPVILFSKGCGVHLKAMADTGVAALGIDWATDLGLARTIVGDRVALQGNLDPMVLFARPEIIRDHVALVLKQFGAGSGHIFNLGHGIAQGTPPEHVAELVLAVREFSPAYHRGSSCRPE